MAHPCFDSECVEGSLCVDCHASAVAAAYFRELADEEAARMKVLTVEEFNAVLLYEADQWERDGL